ncbi:GrpB family protein [Rossellomorea vietnamensis]|uniref:GrpB family protein n=1 Tax=Rossellomorea vietnamensis TaxID=218284 RepID=A0A5D4M9G8_9BACI|nr:GrpB family protein [Rossellomorea vietnamensis]TYR98276.1 GrpB family protein [Rossellomorea vietnamensis]
MEKPVVILSEYNPQWEDQFEYEKKQIMGVSGNKINGIEHIGSTSVRGLKAKPIIDILAGVRDLNVVSSLIGPLSEVDFEYVPKPELTDRSFFRKGLWGKGTCHLHICKINSSEWVDKLLFRDYLRKFPGAAEEYALLKSELSSLYKNDRPAYTKQKEPFIKDIIKKASKLSGS